MTPGEDHPDASPTADVAKIAASANSSKSRELTAIAARTNNIFMKNEGAVEGHTIQANSQYQQQV